MLSLTTILKQDWLREYPNKYDGALIIKDFFPSFLYYRSD
jgi:hypothetical protein